MGIGPGGTLKMTNAFGCVSENGVCLTGAEVNPRQDGLRVLAAERERFVQDIFDFVRIGRIPGQGPGQKGERLTQVVVVNLFGELSKANLFRTFGRHGLSRLVQGFPTLLALPE